MAALHQPPREAAASSSDGLVVNESDTRDETNLVLCFARNNIHGVDPVLYRFQSHPIQSFITKSDTRSKLEPVSQFVWEEELDDEYKKLLCSPKSTHWHNYVQQPHRRTLVPPYLNMSFLNAGDFIYAVGGQRHPQYPSVHMEEDLRTDFVRIHLSSSLQNSKVKLETLTQMPTRNFVGAIAEIGGRIYVISSPYHPYHKVHEHLFEVYDPLNNGWTSLAEPLFLYATDMKNIRSIGRGTLTCFVMDAKLYVSTYHYSSVYDPDLNAWEACTIFSDSAHLYLDEFDTIPYTCGPPFPFTGEPVVFKEKFWVFPTFETETPIMAYHISTNDMKEIKFDCKGLPFGHIRNPLVDLGDDCFLAMLYKYPLIDFSDDDILYDEDHMSAVTFKLIEEKETQGDNDSASILKATMISVHQICSSFDLHITEVKEGAEVSKRLPLTLVSAFLQHSNN